MTRIKILVGTNNPAKFHDTLVVAAGYPQLQLFQPKDLGLDGEVEETGKTYISNAHLKRAHFIGELQRAGLNDFYVISDDGGLEIAALNNEPGAHSRRWRDGVTPMTDQEVIEYALARLKDVPDDNRNAAFVGIISVGHSTHSDYFDVPYRLDGELTKKPVYEELEPGYPFRTLFYLPEHKMMLSKIASLPIEKRPLRFLSHRERGLNEAYKKIIALTERSLVSGDS